MHNADKPLFQKYNEKLYLCKPFLRVQVLFLNIIETFITNKEVEFLEVLLKLNFKSTFLEV